VFVCCSFPPKILAILKPDILHWDAKIHDYWRALSAADQAQASTPDVDEECKRALTPLGFSSEDAEKMLKKAFGWTHSPYWSEEREKEVPTAEAVAGVLGSCDP
jgi:Holliday junction resolvasome RuvABC DNA-binding subunit